MAIPEILILCPMIAIPFLSKEFVTNFILKVNSLSSFISDIAWAYAMLLTTPLVVTVGLSLTIPLSLVGQMFLQSQYASPVYWLGAVIVFLSFLVVNHESKTQEETGIPRETSRPSTGEYETIPREEEMR
jgi:solute carrier family 35 protein F5